MSKPPSAGRFAKAESRIHRFAKFAAQELGGDLTRLETCEPCIHTVMSRDRSEEWTEAWWIATIITGSRFSVFSDMPELENASAIVGVDDVSIYPYSDRLIEVRLGLSVRIDDEEE